MKSIRIRDKYNKELESSVKKDVHSINSKGNIYFKYENLVMRMEDVFLNIKFLFDFEVEDYHFLEDIKTSIKNLSSESLVYLCDTYKYRFVRVYDYIREVISKELKNYEEIYLLSLESLRRGKTVNSLNLSIFIIYMLNGDIREFCEKNLLGNIDHLEVSSLILGNNKLSDISSYEKLISFFYKNEDVFYIMGLINTLHRNSYKKIVASFYIFNIRDIKIEDLCYEKIFILMEYILNFKNAVNKLSNNLLVQENLQIIKKLMVDFKSIIYDISKNKYLNFHIGIDIKFLRVVLSLFDDIRREISNEDLLKYLFEEIIKLIKDRKLQDAKEIVNILNILDEDISEKIFNEFEDEYDCPEFGVFILRLFRNYKYYPNTMREYESYFYITKVIENDCFKIVFLRSLSILYKKNYVSNIGCKFLKIIMNQKELYYCYNSYINFLILKIIEGGES